MSDENVKPKARVRKSHVQELKKPVVKSIIRKSSEQEVKLTNPSEFFERMSQPIESKLFRFIEDMKKNSEEMLDTTGQSRIVEFNDVGKWRWKKIKTSAELREMLNQGEKHFDRYMQLKESAIVKFLKSKEGYNFGDGDYSNSGVGSFPNRQEYTPLIGTPFFKQLYLYDYWEMHSKCFWYKNYSGIAKLIVDMTRNFVMGKGFNVNFVDDGLQDIWDDYEDQSNIQEEARNWCDELTTFGECMLKKIPQGGSLIHRSFDPSTVWEIVTDPENINDVKYYHQQYNTQYQIYTDKDAPTSKYIINQIPPELVLHTKINVTSYEKRGRSDLLAPLLYFKYYEDYMTSKLLRAKNEAAFIWDVEVDGDQDDVNSYIATTQNIMDVPPGSENVHNKAIKRTPLSPTLSGGGRSDMVAQDILSYVAMGVSIPVTYMGTFGQGGGGTKAGALVATEPVAKKMQERQVKMEHLLRRVVKDVIIASGRDPKDPKCAFEINFPEILEEDRSAKIQDLTTAKQEMVISHKTYAYIVAKELKVSKYDYDAEQAVIKQEMQSNPLLMTGLPDPQPGGGLTSDEDPEQTGRAVDRPQIKKDGHSF